MKHEISPLEKRMQMLSHNAEVDLREKIKGLEKEPVIYPLLIFFSIKSRQEYQVNVSSNNGQIIYQSLYLQAVPAFNVFKRICGFFDFNKIQYNRGKPVEECS